VLVALAIAILVLLYDAWGKRHAATGPLNMGLCRAANLMLGVSAWPAALPAAWPLGGIPLLYIGAVTLLSRGEVHGGRRGTALLALISLGIALLALAIVSLRVGGGSLAGLALVGLLGWRVLPPFWKASAHPESGSIRHAVKAGVLSLVLVNAAIAAAYAGAAYSLAVLAVGVLAVGLARRFLVT
jgi:4-hydroxybenzoate polyprenyltransferase